MNPLYIASLNIPLQKKIDMFRQMPIPKNWQPPLTLDQELARFLQLDLESYWDSPIFWEGIMTTQPELVLPFQSSETCRLRNVLQKMIEAKNASRIAKQDMLKLVIFTLQDSWRDLEGINNRSQMIKKMTGKLETGLGLLIKDNTWLDQFFKNSKKTKLQTQN